MTGSAGACDGDDTAIADDDEEEEDEEDGAVASAFVKRYVMTLLPTPAIKRPPRDIIVNTAPLVSFWVTNDNRRLSPSPPLPPPPTISNTNSRPCGRRQRRKKKTRVGGQRVIGSTATDGAR
jgi:hypothetical protein